MSLVICEVGENIGKMFRKCPKIWKKFIKNFEKKIGEIVEKRMRSNRILLGEMKKICKLL